MTAWMVEGRIDVTDKFARIAWPLIGGGWVIVPHIDRGQRFTPLDLILAEKV